MTPKEIIRLLKGLGSKKVVEMEEWVMGSCPFAKWTHAKGTDNRPSFGIHKGADHVYNCFSCGRSGRVVTLPTSLEFLSGQSYQKLREFIQLSTPILTVREDYDSPVNKTLKEIPQSIYQRYPRMFEWGSLTKSDIKLWDLRYDKENNRILYPIYNKRGILVGIRGRSITEKFFISYTHLVPDSLDPKTAGIWFGMVFPLIENKALILVEGERDAILLKRHVTNVWASMGSSLSAKQLESIKQTNNPIIIFFDNDKAGQEGVRKLLKHVEHSRCRVLRSYFGCKDPAEAVERNLITKLLSSDNLIPITKGEN